MPGMLDPDTLKLIAAGGALVTVSVLAILIFRAYQQHVTDDRQAHKEEIATVINIAERSATALEGSASALEGLQGALNHLRVSIEQQDRRREQEAIAIVTALKGLHRRR